MPSFQKTMNFVLPVMMILIMLGGVTSYYKAELNTNTKFKIMEIRHKEEIQDVKKQMLMSNPLNLATYFESTTLMTEYMSFVNRDLVTEDAHRIISAIDIEAQTYPRVTEAMLLFTSQIETNFIVKSTSNVGALGLMQVMPTVWLQSENPKNKDHVGNVGITTREQLMTIEGSVAAGAWILNTYAIQCENLEENNPKKFYSRHKTIPECTSKKYFGGNFQSYFGKLQKAAGNFWFWMRSREKMNGQPRMVNAHITTSYKFKNMES